MIVEFKRSVVDSNPVYVDMVIIKKNIDTARAFITTQGRPINTQDLIGGILGNYKITQVNAINCNCYDVDLLDTTCSF